MSANYELLAYGLDRLRGQVVVLRGQADFIERQAVYFKHAKRQDDERAKAKQLRREADALEAVYQAAKGDRDE